jgi:hypothetical protein
MKFALLFVATLILVGCSHDSPQRSPAALSPSPVPTASPATSAVLWAMVVDEGGTCIDGATIQVVRGQRAGVSVPQTTPCDAWAYDGGVFFKDLTPGEAMTLRATAPGWAPLEMTVVPSSGPYGAFLFTPSRTH